MRPLVRVNALSQQVGKLSVHGTVAVRIDCHRNPRS